MNKKKVIYTAAGIAALILGFICAYQAYDKSQMLDVTREWARLAPLPESKTDFIITTTGGMFTRGFSGSFVAPEADLKKWVADSPGLSSAVTVTLPSGAIKFDIIPGGGAAFAQVVVDFKTGKVEFKTFWS